MKSRTTTPWYKVRLSFILTLLLLFSLFVFGAQRMIVTETLSGREAVLKTNLQQIRYAIDQYKSDHSCAPNSLHDLVDGQYLKEIPLDPFTGKQDWVLVRTTTSANPDQPIAGVVDVQSNSPRRARDGTRYNTW